MVSRQTILIDILHPTHVYVFRDFIKKMTAKGHKIIVVGREKECVYELLEHYKIPHTRIRRKKSLGLELIDRTIKIFNIARKEKVDLLIGCMGPSISIVGRITRRPSLVFYDNEMATKTNWYVQRLATKFMTSHTWTGKRLKNHVEYQSIQQRAYLPKELRREEPTISILRLSAHKSSHDNKSLGIKNPLRIARLLLNCKITSEKPLSEDLQEYETRVKPWELHSLIAKAHMVVGDSPTLCCEAAMLGVPSIYVGNTHRGYIEYLKRKGIVFECDEEDIEKTIKHVMKINSKRIQEEIMKENGDLTKWMVDYVEKERWKEN